MQRKRSRKAQSPDMRLLGCIKQYILKHGYAPSIREMADMIEAKSISTVHAKLLKLMEDGYIESDLEDQGAPRAFRVRGFTVVDTGYSRQDNNKAEGNRDDED